MPEADRLVLLLRRVRRRVYAQKGVEGAVLGALSAVAAADLAMLLGMLLMRSPTPLPWATGAASWLTVLTAGAAAGIALSCWRHPLALDGAARRVDLASARGPEALVGDRVFLAFHLRKLTASPLAATAVGNAVSQMVATPLARVAPWRRPRGLGLLATFGLVALGLTVWPWRSPAQGGTGAATTRMGIGPGEDQAHEVRAEIDSLERVAQRLGDVELMALLSRAELILSAPMASGPEREESLTKLARLVSEAAGAARSGARMAQIYAELGDIFASVPQAEAWAHTLSSLEARASERQAQTAASALSALNDSDRKALARVLDRAADAVQSRSEKMDERQRRLAGLDDDEAPEATGPTTGERQAHTPAAERSLRRLERDLRQSAESCLNDPAACARAVGQAAGSLASEMSTARTAPERSQLARALERELARRRGPGQGGGQEQAQPGARPSGVSEAGSQSPRRPDSVAATARQAGEGDGAEPGEMGGEGSARGSGESGGGTQGSGAASAAPRPDEDGSLAGRGERRQVPLPSRPGPSRAEIIESGARHGFADPGYQRVYREYESALEESLDATAVPPGRRRIVRRYFDLIQPGPAKP